MAVEIGEVCIPDMGAAIREELAKRRVEAKKRADDEKLDQRLMDSGDEGPAQPLKPEIAVARITDQNRDVAGVIGRGRKGGWFYIGEGVSAKRKGTLVLVEAIAIANGLQRKRDVTVRKWHANGTGGNGKA